MVSRKNYKESAMIVCGCMIFGVLILTIAVWQRNTSAASPDSGEFITLSNPPESSGQGGAADHKTTVPCTFIIPPSMIPSQIDTDIGRSMAAHDKAVFEAFECQHELLHVTENFLTWRCIECNKLIPEELTPYEQAVEIEPRKIISMQEAESLGEKLNVLDAELSALRRDILTLRHEIKILNRRNERK